MVDKIVARMVLLGGGTVVPPVPSNPSRVGIRVIGDIRIEGESIAVLLVKCF